MKEISENPFVNWVKWRISKNKNAIIMFNGPTGSGKSWAALSLAEMLAKEFDTKFNVGKNIDFKFVNLLKKTMLKGNDKPGTVFLFEEVGAVGSGSSAKEWMSKANAFFNSFVQTSRHRNQILIMTCPSFSNLDASTRRLVHAQVEMLNINYQKNVSYCKLFVLQVNPRSGKIYFKYLRFKVGKKKGKLKQMKLKKPSKRLINEYEKIKTQYTTELNQYILDSDKPVEKQPKRKVSKEQIGMLLSKGLSTKEIASALNVTMRTIQIYKKGIQNETK